MIRFEVFVNILRIIIISYFDESFVLLDLNFNL